MKTTYVCAALAAIGPLCFAGANAQNQQVTPAEPARNADVSAVSGLANGGFESPIVEAYRHYDEPIPGWIVTDEIEILNKAYGHGFQVRSGSQVLALNESGALYQDVATRPGSIYRLVFYGYTEPDASGAATLHVSAGAARADYKIAPGQPDYQRKTLVFQGAVGATTTRISFASTAGSEAGALIDDVRVDKAARNTK